MDHRFRLLSIALCACLWASGCCSSQERVWRCPDGQCGILSGRFEDCSDCTNCEVCGQLLGHCKCHPWQALRNRFTCGKGCGEVYWGEWHGDPPDPCDPCDPYGGNYVGKRPCPLPWYRRTTNMLLGRRCCDPCNEGYCDDGGCGAVGPGQPAHAGYNDGMQGELAPTESLVPSARPTLAPPASKAAPSSRVPAAPRTSPPPAARPPRAPADEAPMLEGPEARRTKPTVRTTSAGKGASKTVRTGAVGSGLRR
jgi:hypothetical protein